MSVAGISLIEVDARIVVASIDTYVRQSETVPRALVGSPCPVAATALAA